MAVERFQSTLVFLIKCWQKVKFLNSSSSKIKTKQLWAAMQPEPRQRIPMLVRMTDCRKPAQTAGRFSHGTPRRGQRSPSRSSGWFGSAWTDGELESRFTEREMNLSPSWFTGAPRGRCVCVCNLFEKGNKSAVVPRSRSISYICFSSENKTSGHQKRTRMVSGRGKYCDSGRPAKKTAST